MTKNNQPSYIPESEEELLVRTEQARELRSFKKRHKPSTLNKQSVKEVRLLGTEHKSKYLSQ